MRAMGVWWWIVATIMTVAAAGEVRWVDYLTAQKIAKTTGRMIMIEASSPHCHYCVRMERTTLQDPWVKGKLAKGFVPVRVDVSREKLPGRLSWHMTPTFFFLTAEGRLIKTVPGAWDRDDFLQILDEAKGALR